MSLNIVLTDCATVNAGDLDLTVLERFGKVTYYTETRPEDVCERIKDADIIITDNEFNVKKTNGYRKNLNRLCSKS